MAKADIQIVDSGAQQVSTKVFKVEDRTTSSEADTIKPGEPVKISGTGSNFVAPLAAGDPEIGTDRMVGIAASESTETSSADGEVEVYLIRPGQTVMRAKAETSGNLADGILNDSVTFDISSGSFVIDENEGDDPDVHGLLIVDYDADRGTVDFVLKTGASLEGEV